MYTTNLHHWTHSWQIGLLIQLTHTVRTQYRKFETNIPRKGIALPQSQLPHSRNCERFINSHNRSDYSVAGKYGDQSWEYIIRSQTHACGNLDWGRAIPRKGIHKWDCRCSAPSFTLDVILYTLLFRCPARWTGPCRRRRRTTCSSHRAWISALTLLPSTSRGVATTAYLAITGYLHAWKD